MEFNLAFKGLSDQSNVSNAMMSGENDGRLRYIKETISGSLHQIWTLSFKTLPLPHNCYGSNTDVWDQQDRVLQHGWQKHAIGSSQDSAYLSYFFHYIAAQCSAFSINSKKGKSVPLQAWRAQRVPGS